MPTSDLITRLEREFTPNQARLLAEEIEAVSSDLVRARDFTELKEIVRDLGLSQKELAEAQKRTEVKVEELAEAQKRTEVKVEELAEAQKRTEVKVEELAEAQKRTEVKVEELAEAQKRTEEEIRKLTLSHSSLRQEVGGVANAIGYMLENEAYRNLPKLLADKYNIAISNRIIRKYVGAEEINFLAEGSRDETPVLIVGEAKSRLAAHHFTELKGKIKEVETHYPAAAGREIVPIIVVHSAREKELKRAEREGVIVVQSFEW